MLKKLCLFCALILAVSCGKTESKPSYLLVVMSNHGEVKKASDGSYQLILDHGDIEKVLAFTDRPYRIVKHLTGEELKSLWSEGPNSFTKDHPNAAVIINQHLQTVELINIKVEGKKTIFTVQADGPQSLVEMSGKTQLFADEAWCMNCFQGG